ncbi:MAG: hypothetical protein ACR2M3_19275 [Thermomicrobiales bacterium]
MNAPELLDIITHETPGSGDAGATDTENPTRRGAGMWGALLVLIVVFGYLTASRRKALGTFAEQVADIVRDFRDYDPEF